MNDLKARLSNVDLFSHLTEEQLELLARHSREQLFKKNSLVIREGEAGDTMFVVDAGELKVFVSDENGRELVLRQIGAGAVIGDLALLDNQPRSASVQAMSDVKVIAIAREGMHHCLSSSPEFALNIIRSLTLRLRQATEGSRSLALDNVYRRLADKLRELANVKDDAAAWEDDADAPRLARKYSHQELGNLIGASREMVGKVMAELVKGDYVAIDEGCIVLRKKLPRNW